MKFRPLATNERAETPTFTHVGSITADDLTNTTVTVTQTIQFCDLIAGDQVLRVMWHLKTPFQNTAIAGDNATTASVGDNAGVATHLSAAVVNVNGTEIVWRAGNTAVLYTAADKLAVTFTPTSGSPLSNLNRGELLVFVSLARLKTISDAVASTQINKT